MTVHRLLTKILPRQFTAAARRLNGQSPSAKPCISQHKQHRRNINPPQARCSSTYYRQIRFLPHRKHRVSITKAIVLMLFREMTKRLTPRSRAIVKGAISRSRGAEISEYIINQKVQNCCVRRSQPRTRERYFTGPENGGHRDQSFTPEPVPFPVIAINARHAGRDEFRGSGLLRT